MTLTITKDGYIDLMQREAIVLVPYVDGDGWSQGIGSQTNYSADPHRPVRADDPPITVQQAVDWLKVAVDHRMVVIEKKLKVPITDHQATALHSIYYQFGSVALDRITGLFNEGKPMAAMLAFSEFPFGQNRKQTEGHSKRRLCEMAIAMFGYYGEQDKVPVFDGNPRETERRYIDASTLEL